MPNNKWTQVHMSKQPRVHRFYETHLCCTLPGPQNDKQREIVNSYMHAWNAYKKYAWGHDELKPVSHGWQEWFGIGLTIVDSLDTMWIMGLKDGKQRCI